MRQVGRAIREDDRFTVSLLPVSDGLLVAVKH
jgi:predicted O-methyltransferase YrrM